MASLNIGDFRQRVTFKNVTKTPDNSNGNSETFATLLSTFAYIRDGGGSRNFLGASDKMVDSKDIYVFYRADLIDNLETDTRIVYNGVDYSIDRYSIVDEVKRIVKFETSGIR